MYKKTNRQRDTIMVNQIINWGNEILNTRRRIKCIKGREGKCHKKKGTKGETNFDDETEWLFKWNGAGCH